MGTADTRVFADPDMMRAEPDGAAEGRIRAEISRLGLQANISELDDRGVTVLRPDQVRGLDFLERLRTRLLDHAEARDGVLPDWRSEGAISAARSVLGQTELYTDIFFVDPVFEEALMTPSVLAVLSYLLGESCVLNAFNAVIKGRGDEHVPVHNDAPGPEPKAPYALVANATWLLTDYEEDSGTTCFLPGSHKLCRGPIGPEKSDLSRMEPLIAPAGWVAIWHGNTWHAARPRKAAGLRMNILSLFSRHFIAGAPPEYALSTRITAEMCARNPDRFATLTGARGIDRYTQMMAAVDRFA